MTAPACISSPLAYEMRSRFPATHLTNGKGKEGRGIGSHTDYGLLVMAAQDEVGGESVDRRGRAFDRAALLTYSCPKKQCV